MVAVKRPLKLKRRSLPKDGLYQVTSVKRSRWQGRTGGFLVHRGRVTRMTPHLRHDFQMSAHRGVFLGEPWA
jgi:hypothetical protein